MSINIADVEGYTLAEVASVVVNGQQGIGAYVLVLGLRLSIGKVRTDAQISNLSIRLDIAGGGRRILGWGTVDTIQPINITEHTSNQSIQSFFLLSPYQIQALEKLRNGRDLNINVWFSGEVRQEGKIRQFSDCKEYVISQQEWLKALEQMGFSKTLLFELSLPDAEIDEEKTLLELIHTAKTHLNKGYYNESVGCCRKAIEFVEKYYDDKKLAAQSRKQYTENREEMDAKQRILFLREGLKNVTHLGPHFHEKGDFSYLQAQSILGMTVAILSLATNEVIN